MWLNDLFWGKRKTFVGKYHFFVINDHLWGPSVHVDKSVKKTGRSETPPSRQCLYFGKDWYGTPSLKRKNNDETTSSFAVAWQNLGRMPRIALTLCLSPVFRHIYIFRLRLLWLTFDWVCWPTHRLHSLAEEVVAGKGALELPPLWIALPGHRHHHHYQLWNCV